jgi:SAM-dependent methyltransferase
VRKWYQRAHYVSARRRRELACSQTGSHALNASRSPACDTEGNDGFDGCDAQVLMTGTVPEFEGAAFQEIQGDDRTGLDIVAKMHMELLDYGPMAGLGRRFIREICYRTHMRDELLRVVVATVGGRPAGFVAYTPYSTTFHRSGLRRHFFRAAIETLIAVLSHPLRLWKLGRAIRVLRSRRGEIGRFDDYMGEVVCVAVRPEYLSRQATRQLGARVSETLIVTAVDFLRRCGIERMRMIVDADNRPVLMLYHQLGARFSQYEVGGEPVVEVVFDLSSGNLGRDPGVPAVWSDPVPPPVGGSSWRDYWESIGERRKVFDAEARHYVRRLIAAVAPDRRSRVLDFGCGFGYAARHLAPHVGEVALWDASMSVRRRARLRTAALSNVAYIDLSAAETDPAHAFDLIMVHSVVQYMELSELQSWLVRWRRMLAPGGRLVISDLIQPRTSLVQDLLGYMRFSLANGYFLEAMGQGLREIPGYSRARLNRPLLALTVDHLDALARATGWNAEFLSANLSHRRNRKSAVLTPSSVDPTDLT